MDAMILLLAMVCAVVSASVAAIKYRSALGYGLLGFFFPLIGVVTICCLPRVKRYPYSI